MHTPTLNLWQVERKGGPSTRQVPLRTGVTSKGMPPNPSVAVYWRVATVLVEVTLPHVEDRSNPLPGDILAVVQDLPHVQENGWSRRGSSPWRARFLVRGADCIATARSLERRLRDLGYDADASFWP